MSEKVHQLCATIARHPSKINLLNEAIATAIADAHPDAYRPLLDLLRKLTPDPQLASFLAAKLQAILLSLLQTLLDRQDRTLLPLLGETYLLADAEQQGEFVRKLLGKVGPQDLVGRLQWPGVVVGRVLEELADEVESGKGVGLEGVGSLLMKLPHLNELQLPEETIPVFKKNYQRLLLLILGSESAPRALLFDLYHNLGDRMLSKLTNPLVLSNHCLSRFTRDSALQIQILACLFVLVGKHGLELEEFYPKLQKLITQREQGRSIYELPNSKRFFKLLEAALRSSRVPFKTVGLFAQLLVSQLPGEEGGFAFWALSFLVNLTKKHRQLLAQLPLAPEIKLLKYHYNSKIRALVSELQKNLNKTDYLEIDEFARVDTALLAAKKHASVVESLGNDELEFKIPVFEDYL